MLRRWWNMLTMIRDGYKNQSEPYSGEVAEDSSARGSFSNVFMSFRDLKICEFGKFRGQPTLA